MAPHAQIPSSANRRPDLATLASIAALELDEKIEGHPVALDGVRHLVRNLRTTIRFGEGTGKASLLDPVSADVFTRALAPRAATEKPYKVAELLETVRRLIGMLEQPQDLGRNDLIQMRTFCLKLSQSAQAEASFYATEDEHPFRR